MMRMQLGILTAAFFLATVTAAQAAEWHPAEGPLTTRWAKDVSPENVWPEYPRPQMVRRAWQNLNGLWDYAILPKDQAAPRQYDGEILVPFCVESALSGVKKAVGPANRLWYRRTFTPPADAKGQRLILHFGAVDWQARVWVNGQSVGEHKGGYDPFSFDITDALKAKGDQELVVSVWDPANEGFQPRGKQVIEPRGIWYTSVTGIWRTVWLEPVPEAHIASLKIVPDVDNAQVAVTVNVDGCQAHHRVLVQAQRESFSVLQDGKPGEAIVVAIPKPDLWSPDSPALYDLTVTLSDARQAASPQQPVDRVTSYFGMRKIEVQKDEDGFNRLFLNNKPLFQLGPLDQGWWPDGLYTAPTDAALRYDIEVTKQLGFNMCRKHVKVEPPRWYYWCDKLGLLVWQDMPNGDGHIGRDQPDLERSAESAENYRHEFKALIDWLHNHPSIVAWVPFNEGWGQFQTDKVLAWTKEYDPTRLVDGPSGWADRGTGDMHDLHRYPGPAMPEPEPQRAAVLGEFGGLGLPMEGHLWWDKRNWGYRTYKSRQELQQNYDQLIRNLRPLIGRGLAAAVYTQTTDVEGEVNGLMTYDRAVIKYDAEKLAKAHARLYEPQPIVITKTVVPTSETTPHQWRFSTDEPPKDWQQPGFDDSAWKQGPAGFGAADPPGHVIRTKWDTPDIWLRRTFNLETTKLARLHLRIHHDEDAQVFINGRLAALLTGYQTSYVEVEADPAASNTLRSGENTIAVHCHQTRGGQYIDVGLIDVIEKPRAK